MCVKDLIHLKRLEKSDAEKLSSIANDKSIWLNLRDVFPHPYSKLDAENFIDMVSAESPELTFGIFFEDKLAGVIGLTPFTDVNRIKAEVGFWIGKQFQGKGIASTALKLMYEYAFKELGFVRLEAFVFEQNKASVRVLEKNGFSLDAKLEKSAKKNGVILDQFLFSKISPTYR